VIYKITPLGESLGSVFASLAGWSEHLPEVEEARQRYDAPQPR
jgi:DNA-binding HxlR family transcriptional regulator